MSYSSLPRRRFVKTSKGAPKRHSHKPGNKGGSLLQKIRHFMKTAGTQKKQRVDTVVRMPKAGEITVYHGTSQVAAKDIASCGRNKPLQMFTGGTNAYGEGIYFAADFNVAKSYAGTNGLVIKARLRPGKTCVWSVEWDQRWQKWCKGRGVPATNGSKTVFLRSLGFQTLHVKNQGYYIVLIPQYADHLAHKIRLRQASLLDVLDISGRSVRV